VIDSKLYGMFTLSDRRSTVYHLTLDDKTSLCGLDVSRMDCVGETGVPTPDFLFSYVAATTILHPRCKRCERALREKA